MRTPIGWCASGVLSVDGRVARLLEDGRLPPGAPGLAQGVAHLAEGRVRASGLNDVRHDVLILAQRSLAEPAECLLYRRRIAPSPDCLDALDLLPLERRVDAKDVEFVLVVERVPVDADDD